MAARMHLLSLFSLLSVAVVLSAFQAAPVSALSAEYHQHHVRNFHQHDVVAKKRSTKQKRCKSRPTPASASSAVSSKSPAIVVSSSHAPAVSSSNPSSSHSSSPSPTSSPKPKPPSPAAPSPSPPPPPPPPKSTPSSQSSSSSSVADRLKKILPHKALLAYGGSPAQLEDWKLMDGYYNWGVDSSGSGGPSEFFPTLWGTKNKDAWTSSVLHAQTPYPLVFTMNEPEIITQSNLSPQDAATLWNEVVLPLVGGETLVACPAMTSDPGAPGWLNQFFAACNNGHEFCGCDLMNFHYYGTDTAAFISFVQNMQSQFKLPTVYTEFACELFGSDGQQCDQGQVQNFASTMANFFETTDYIYGYSAFGAMIDLGNVNPDNGLMNADGSPNGLAVTYYPVLGN